MLVRWLTRLGLPVSGGVLTAVLSRNATVATAPMVLVQAALQTAKGVVPIAVAAVTKGMLKAMLITKIKSMFVFTLSLGVLAYGAALLAGVGGAQVDKSRDQESANTVRSDRNPATDKANAELAWKADFRKAYGLKDDELIRRVTPPYPECRAEYFRDQIRELFKREKMDPPEAEVNRDYTNYWTKFGWKNDWTVAGQTTQSTSVKPDVGVSLARVLDATVGLARIRIEGEEDLLERKITGDFVVRAGANPDKLIVALEKLLRKECDFPVSLAYVEKERDVYVLSGKYEPTPLADRKKNEIEVYGFALTNRDTGGGGSGSLQEMADHVEGWINTRIAVEKIDGAPKKVQWHFNFRSPFTDAEHAADKNPPAVMNNIAAQTGLTVKLENRKVKVLEVKRGS